MLPVLIQFPFPDFLGQVHWIEIAVTAAMLGGLFVWRRSKPFFSIHAFLFWTGIYIAVRAAIYYALLTEPGYVFKLHTYGVAIAVGFVVGIYLAIRQARREGVSADVVLDLSFWILIASMVGSRVLFIIVNIDDYIAEPINLVKIWTGGLVFYGGFLGAVLAAWIYCYRQGISFFRISDIMVPSVAIGHCFGRLGCYSAGCCHGLPTGSEVFGAIFTSHGTVVARNKLLGVALHPTQLYEALGECAIFIALILLRKRKRFHGQLLVAYLILYALLRSVNEMFRGDYERGMLVRIDLFGDASPELLSTSQLISIALAALGVGILLSVGRAKKRSQPEASAVPEP
ncbi:MAG: prolipoprotein diacylglyceryl transferase [Deltaproteobacteria bacterium]|nr:prolipoprotein diacylglyceryl transferase [Deltaproteobacteria bacterium]